MNRKKSKKNKNYERKKKNNKKPYNKEKSVFSQYFLAVYKIHKIIKSLNKKNDFNPKMNS